MATVYLARDPRHERPVAFKALRPDLSAIVGPERFLRESRLTAAPQHPHILPLLDSGKAGGPLYHVNAVCGGRVASRAPAASCKLRSPGEPERH